MKYIGINPATKPVKSLVDIVFSLVLNPTFWRQRHDNIKVGLLFLPCSKFMSNVLSMCLLVICPYMNEGDFCDILYL